MSENEQAKRAALEAAAKSIAAERLNAGVPIKQAIVQVRLDDDLAHAVAEKARQYGGVSAVVRAMLRRWVQGAEMITPDDVLAEVTRAVTTYDQREPRTTRRKPRSK